MNGEARQFKAGFNYAIRTQTVSVKRKARRPNLAGEMEDLEFTGQELVIFVMDENQREACFMDARLRLPANRQAGAPDVSIGHSLEIHFTLQELAEHFVIPNVPDVADINPEGYRRHFEALGAIEQLMS